jgi:hypothetical protein
MAPLPHADLLTTIAEVSAAFVGFSLVVGVLRSRGPGSVERFLASRDVAEIGLIAVAAAFLPMALYAHGWGLEVCWRVASLGLSAAWLGSLGVAVRRRMREGVATPGPALVGVLLTLGVVGNGLLLANTFAPGPGSGARYITALLVFLVLAGILFIIATFTDADDSNGG